MSPEEPTDRAADASARSEIVWPIVALVCVLVAAGWWASRTIFLPRDLSLPDSPDLAPSEIVEAPGDSLSGDGAPGVVRVQVVDARDGSALAGIKVDLFCEEPVRRRFGQAVSDTLGMARFEGVLAPIAMARATRSPDFAAAVALAEGSATAERFILLRLGQGGTIFGRVVDDTGAPVVDAQILVTDNTPWPDPAEPSQLVGRTDRDGRYRIERAVDLPRLISMGPGGRFAAGWSNVIVEARGPAGIARAAQPVLTCGDAICPDLVLLRPPQWRGSLYDSARRPLAGALVSVNPARQKMNEVNLHVVDPAAIARGAAELPGSARFQLLDGEALTAEDGSFAVRGATPRSIFLVAQSSGRLDEFPLGAWEPGALVDDVQLHLEERELLRMRLFDSEGRPILGAPPDSVPLTNWGDEDSVRIAPLAGPLMVGWSASKVELRAELTDGSEVRALCAPDGEGVFCFSLSTPLPAIERLSIHAPGYKPRVRECNGRLRQSSVVGSEQLERLGALELLVERSGDLDDPPGSEAQEVQIRVCALEPVQVVRASPGPHPTCCGLGMGAYFRMTARARRISIPMHGAGPYWLTVRTSRGSLSEELVLGPFEPGTQEYAVEIPALTAASASQARQRATANRRDPRPVEQPLTAVVCVFDDATGAGIIGAKVWPICDPLGIEVWRSRTWSSDADGCATLDGLSAGPWTFAIRAPGYAPAVLGPIDVRAADPAGAELDLGEVRLQPAN